MKAAAGALLLAAIFEGGGRRVSPAPRYFRYSRIVTGATIIGRPVCTVLDASVMAHAQRTLGDLRLMVLTNDGPVEIPYALTMSQTAGGGVEVARVLQSEGSATRRVVELEMPARPYSEVRLQMGGKDFVGTAKVTGLRAAGERGGVAVGTVTVFDLSAQKLGRDTTLRLAEASSPDLRVELEASEGALPEVTGAEVPPSREAQTLFTTVVSAKAAVQGKESVASFEVPAGVPVERVTVDVAAAGNFSRSVKLRARAIGQSDAAAEEVSAEIARVKLTGPRGEDIREAKLGFAATLGSNARGPAKVQIAVENGEDAPLPIQAVRLEMRRREMCFDPPVEPATLFYGDADLMPPSYEFSRQFSPAGKLEMVGLGPEKRNPRFIGRDESRSVSETHPELVLLVLLGVISIFGVVGFRVLQGKS